jgi:hypothetical protein
VVAVVVEVVVPAGAIRPLSVSRARPRQTWPWSVAAVTVAGVAAAIGLAPSANATPDRGLSWLLVIGSAVHVAGTGWLFTFPDVRAHAAQHRARYVAAPLALVAAGGVVAVVVSTHDLAVALLGYFGWQFFHYQKQNLGLAAVTASSLGRASPTLSERNAILATGWAGIAALMLRPSTLQLPLHPHVGWYPALPLAVTDAGMVAGVVAGLVALARRPAEDRPLGFCAVYLLGLGFPLPIFVFSSPYAAVGGMTIAHGLQYLLLVGMVAAGPPSRRAAPTRLLPFAVLTLALGLLLSLASHLHSGDTVARAGYGAYLGVVMAHFVVDAGIWRLRDPFPRRFLAARIPDLLSPPKPPVGDASVHGVM